jgi:hypothetical protein
MFSDAQLEQMAPHIKYEIDEYRRSMKDLQSTRGKPEWNRTLESTLLHFRVLRGFFLSEGKNNDSDVFAAHYIQAWKPNRDPIFGRTKVPIDKRIAHLTIERLQRPEQWNELDLMSSAIEKLILNFKNQLPAARKNWFADLDAAVLVAVLATANNSTQSFGP